MHKEKIFTGKNIKLCLTGKVITMYDLEGNKIVTYFEKSISNAMKRFSLQCDILEGRI